MTYRQLTRKLSHLGCAFERQAAGSHEVWYNPATGGRTTVPNWGSRDLRPGTIGQILRDLEIQRAAFERA